MHFKWVLSNVAMTCGQESSPFQPANSANVHSLSCDTSLATSMQDLLNKVCGLIMSAPNSTNIGRPLVKTEIYDQSIILEVLSFG